MIMRVLYIFFAKINLNVKKNINLFLRNHMLRDSHIRGINQ